MDSQFLDTRSRREHRLRPTLVALAGAFTAIAAWTAAASVNTGAALDAAPLDATQIVERNAAARGGVEAWRKVQTMVWIGHIQSPHGPMPSLPFSMAQKRPNKTHFEINAMGQKTLRVFDGVAGWKVHARGDGSPDVQAFSPQDARFARDGQGIDGPLIDGKAKGNAVALEAKEQVEGQDAFRLNVRFASGDSELLWVDARSFLELKSERTSYAAGGAVAGKVTTYYRDYKEFEGLRIPTTIETGVGSGQGTDKMVIERVVINAPLDDRGFTRAAIDGRKPGIARGLDPAVHHAPQMPPPQTAQSTPPASAVAGPDSAQK
jgi:hypothetical protein